MGQISQGTAGNSSIKVSVTDTKTAAISALVKTENIGNGDKDIISVNSDKVYLNDQEIQSRSFIDNYLKSKSDNADIIKTFKDYGNREELLKEKEQISEKYHEYRNELKENNPYSEKIREIESKGLSNLTPEEKAERIQLIHEKREYIETNNPYSEQLSKIDDRIQGCENLFNSYFSKLDNDYISSSGFCYPIDEKGIYPNVENLEGWKVHISISDPKEYLFCVDKILPELESNSISHKIIDFSRLDSLNDSSQQGKGITLYTENLYDLNKLSNEVKDFLSIDNGINVLTDLELGGKVFARYAGYTSDEIFNPNTLRLENIEREEGLYKPDWIPEPPSLEDIFNNNTLEDERSYLSQNTMDLYNENLEEIDNNDL